MRENGSEPRRGNSLARTSARTKLCRAHFTNALKTRPAVLVRDLHSAGCALSRASGRSIVRTAVAVSAISGGGPDRETARGAVSGTAGRAGRGCGPGGPERPPGAGQRRKPAGIILAEFGSSCRPGPDFGRCFRRVAAAREAPGRSAVTSAVAGGEAARRE
jgi:hypothetical protein